MLRGERTGPMYCVRCGERINPARAVWLELNSTTGEYTDKKGAIPENDSQGWFEFGAACAKRLLQEQKQAV